MFRLKLAKETSFFLIYFSYNISAYIELILSILFANLRIFELSSLVSVRYFWKPILKAINYNIGKNRALLYEVWLIWVVC